MKSCWKHFGLFGYLDFEELTIFADWEKVCKQFKLSMFEVAADKYL